MAERVCCDRLKGLLIGDLTAPHGRFLGRLLPDVHHSLGLSGLRLKRAFLETGAFW